MLMEAVIPMKGEIMVRIRRKVRQILIPPVAGQTTLSQAATPSTTMPMLMVSKRKKLMMMTEITLAEAEH
jgi:hypothetical protein